MGIHTKKIRTFILKHKVTLVVFILLIILSTQLQGNSPTKNYKSCSTFANTLTKELAEVDISNHQGYYQNGWDTLNTPGTVKSPNLSSFNKKNITHLKCLHEYGQGPAGTYFHYEYEMSGIDENMVDFYVHGLTYESPSQSSGGGGVGKQYCYISGSNKYSYKLIFRGQIEPGDCRFSGYVGDIYEYTK